MLADYATSLWQKLHVLAIAKNADEPDSQNVILDAQQFK